MLPETLQPRLYFILGVAHICPPRVYEDWVDVKERSFSYYIRGNPITYYIYMVVSHNWETPI